MVIFLSVALGVFLLLGIIALVKIIQVLNHLKSISQKAADFADKAEAVGEFLEQAAKPLAVATVLSNFADGFFRRSKERKKGKNDE